MTTLIAAGIIVGVTLGFYVGRRWAEYFRAVEEGRRAMVNRQNYHGKSTFAFVLGGLLILGLAIFFGNSPSF